MRCFVYRRFEGDFRFFISAECDIRLACAFIFHDEAFLQVTDVRFIRRDITFVGRNFCFYIFQLFEIDRIAVCFTGCHVGDFIVIRIDTIAIDICLITNFEFIT